MLTLPEFGTLAALAIEMKTEPLIKGNYYHIYNRGNNGIDLFMDDENYLHFLSLYEKPFKRKKIDSEKYLKQVIFYIHNNPVHHGFEKRIIDYPWSSYGKIISTKPTKLKKAETIGYFEDIDNFINYHNQEHDLAEIKEILID